MSFFKYHAKNDHGEPIKGKVEAKSKSQAALILRDRQLLVVSLKPVDEGNFSELTAVLSGVKFNDVVNFTQQLSTMITAGLPLVEALSILEQQSKKQSYIKLVSELLRDLESGTSFADALAKHPKVFGKTYVQLVRAGEAGGILDEVLSRSAENMEKSKAFRSKIKGAMIYPVIVLVGMVVAIIIMMVAVVPKMAQMYDDLGSELPTMTQIIIDASNWIKSFWWLMGLLLMLGFFAFRAWKKTAKGAMAFDKFLFKLPIFGSLRTKTILTEYSRTLALLLSAGVSLLKSLEIVSKSMESPQYQEKLKECTGRVEKGIPLSQALGRFDIFPTILIQMTAVGEETGKLDDVMLKLSAFFQAESESAVKALTSAMEPMIIIVLAIGVGFMVVAIILPIYGLTNQF
ncbi:MAG: type II secretion system F family protein [Patescibacteria group bacterium]